MNQQKQNRIQQFRTFLRSDRAILLLCMSIALIFWLFIKLSKSYEASRAYSVNYSFPESKIFVDKLPSSIVATVEGVGWDLMGNNFSGKKNKIDFQLQNQESQTIDRTQIIASIAKQLPSSIEVKDISLNYVNILLDDLSKKKIPVELDRNIKLESGFQLKNITVVPDSVLLVGPASLVQHNAIWKTKPVNLQKIKTNQQIDIELSPTKNEQLKVQPEKIQVNVEVEQLTEGSLFVPVTIQNAPDSLNIFPKQIKVSYVVGLSQFDQIRVDDFKLVVDLKNTSLQSENNTIPVSLIQQPSFVKNVNYDRKSVKFFFVKEEKEAIEN